MLNIFILSLIALPHFNTELEAILFKKNLSSSYPVENINILYVEKILPGPVFDGKTYDDLHWSTDPNSKDNDEEKRVERLLTHSRIRRILIDSRNEPMWMRIDSAWIVDEYANDRSKIDSAMDQSQVRIVGPRGKVFYNQGIKSGIIKKDMQPFLYAPFWEWAASFKLKRQRNIDEIVPEMVYDQILSSARSIAPVSSMNEEGNKIHISWNAGNRSTSLVLRKDWNYHLEECTNSYDGHVTNIVVVKERIPVDEGRYWFPKNVKYVVYGREQECDEINKTIEITVLEAGIWEDIPAEVFNYPFMKGDPVLDHRSGEPKDINWPTDEDFIKTNEIHPYSIIPIKGTAPEENSINEANNRLYKDEDTIPTETLTIERKEQRGMTEEKPNNALDLSILNWSLYFLAACALAIYKLWKLYTLMMRRRTQ